MRIFERLEKDGKVTWFWHPEPSFADPAPDVVEVPKLDADDMECAYQLGLQSQQARPTEQARIAVINILDELCEEVEQIMADKKHKGLQGVDLEDYAKRIARLLPDEQATRKDEVTKWQNAFAKEGQGVLSPDDIHEWLQVLAKTVMAEERKAIGEWLDWVDNLKVPMDVFRAHWKAGIASLKAGEPPQGKPQ